MQLSEFFKQARAELRQGRSVYACLVVDQQKGSPGTKAARLLLSETGQQYGTIGGGIMEKKELETGATRLQGCGLSQPELRVVEHRASAEAAASGLICGGAQTNLRLILRPDRHLEVIEAITTALIREHDEVVCIDKNAIQLQAASKPWQGDAVQLTDAGSEAWCVEIYLRNRRRMAIFGGGHCGAALARLMARLEYGVTIIEPRSGVLDTADLPDSVCRINESFEAGAAQVNYPSETLAVVMTYSMLTDVDALAATLACGFKSIGVMGSRPKIAQIRSKLLEKGFSRLHIDSIHAPIGIRFNSDTPEEIAVSVAAQVLLDREKNNHG